MSQDILMPIRVPRFHFTIATPIGSLPELGHAGILMIDGTSGTTKYFREPLGSL